MSEPQPTEPTEADPADVQRGLDRPPDPSNTPVEDIIAPLDPDDDIYQTVDPATTSEDVPAPPA